MTFSKLPPPHLGVFLEPKETQWDQDLCTGAKEHVRTQTAPGDLGRIYILPQGCLLPLHFSTGISGALMVLGS